MAYPAPKRRTWIVQVEFLDGTIIDASSDEDAMDRWRRLATWTDPTAETNQTGWQQRILERARSVYGASLPQITNLSSPTELLEALDKENCLSLRRK